MPAAQAADRISDRIARIVYVESGPLPDGTAQFDTVPPEEQQRLRAAIGTGHLLPPPAWDPAADPTNLAGLDEPTLALLRYPGHPAAAAGRHRPGPTHRRAPGADRAGRQHLPAQRGAADDPRRGIRSSPAWPTASCTSCPPGTGRCSASRRRCPTSSTWTSPKPDPLPPCPRAPPSRPTPPAPILHFLLPKCGECPLSRSSKCKIGARGGAGCAGAGGGAGG